MDNALAEYSPNQYNVLMPVPALSTNDVNSVTIETVTISPNPNDGEVYAPTGGRGALALRKPALFKLASAAGIQWHPTECKRVDNLSNPDLVIYRAVAAVRKPSGEPMIMSASYELYLPDVEAEIRFNYENKQRKDPKKYPDIDYLVKRDILQIRKYKHELAETKAMLRVIRAMLTIKSTYKAQELQRPFAIPRIDFDPMSSTDPTIRDAARTVLAAEMFQLNKRPKRLGASGSEEWVTYQQELTQLQNGAAEAQQILDDTGTDDLFKGMPEPIVEIADHWSVDPANTAKITSLQEKRGLTIGQVLDALGGIEKIGDFEGTAGDAMNAILQYVPTKRDTSLSGEPTDHDDAWVHKRTAIVTAVKKALPDQSAPHAINRLKELARVGTIEPLMDDEVIIRLATVEYDNSKIDQDKGSAAHLELVQALGKLDDEKFTTELEILGWFITDAVRSAVDSGDANYEDGVAVGISRVMAHVAKRAQAEADIEAEE
jgi:hypothetical protein